MALPTRRKNELKDLLLDDHSWVEAIEQAHFEAYRQQTLPWMRKVLDMRFPFINKGAPDPGNKPHIIPSPIGNSRHR